MSIYVLISSDMAHLPKEMKPIGYTVREQQGDWLITWEVIGYNENLHCNVWAQQKRTWNPRPSLSQVIEVIDRDKEWQQTKMLHRQITGK